jgi:hypothetical protein
MAHDTNVADLWIMFVAFFYTVHLVYDGSVGTTLIMQVALIVADFFRIAYFRISFSAALSTFCPEAWRATFGEVCSWSDDPAFHSSTTDIWMLAPIVLIYPDPVLSFVEYVLFDVFYSENSWGAFAVWVLAVAAVAGSLLSIYLSLTSGERRAPGDAVVLTVVASFGLLVSLILPGLVSWSRDAFSTAGRMAVLFPLKLPLDYKFAWALGSRIGVLFMIALMRTITVIVAFGALVGALMCVHAYGFSHRIHSWLLGKLQPLVASFDTTYRAFPHSFPAEEGSGTLNRYDVVDWVVLTPLLHPTVPRWFRSAVLACKTGLRICVCFGALTFLLYDLETGLTPYLEGFQWVLLYIFAAAHFCAADIPAGHVDCRPRIHNFSLGFRHRFAVPWLSDACFYLHISMVIGKAVKMLLAMLIQRVVPIALGISVDVLIIAALWYFKRLSWDEVKTSLKRDWTVYWPDLRDPVLAWWFMTFKGYAGDPLITRPVDSWITAGMGLYQNPWGPNGLVTQRQAANATNATNGSGSGGSGGSSVVGSGHPSSRGAGFVAHAGRVVPTGA